VDEDPSICFFRARADGSVWNDCGGLPFKDLLEKILNRPCTHNWESITAGTVFHCPF